MWDGIFGKRNFYTKCKMALKMIKLRMEPIMKKRKAMQKFLKNDIADLLKNNLDYNAYGRAEGLYVEMNLSSCYNYVHECCKIVADNLKAMHKERECPQECRVAVASLMLAAARFSDLLELRDLRAEFAEKYGNELDHYVSVEFVEKLKLKPSTMELKFQLMKDIAKEVSIAWEPTSLEHKLNSPAKPIQQDQCKMNRAMSDDSVLSRKEPLATRSGLEKVVSAPTTDDVKKVDRSNQEEEARPRPKSVRSRFIRNTGNGKGVARQETKDDNDKSLEGGDDEEGDQEILIDRLLRHYSTKSWRTPPPSSNGTEIPWPSRKRENESEPEGGAMYRSRSASVYTNRQHPKLPDYDELAYRVEALTKM